MGGADGRLPLAPLPMKERYYRGDLAVILGMTIGFTGVLVCGVVAYVAAAIAAAQVPTE